jgi:hypothetical protein
MLFKKMIAIYSENHKKNTQMCEQNADFSEFTHMVHIDTSVPLIGNTGNAKSFNIKSDGAYCYHYF